MTKKNAIFLGAAAVAIIGGLGMFMMHSLSEQRATNQQLEDFKKQLAAATQNTAQPAASQSTPVQVTIGDTATQTGSTLDRVRLVNQVISEGEKLLEMHDPAKAETAIKIFRDAIEKIDDKNADFYSGLGKASLIAQHPGDATQAYHKALELKPNRPDLWLGIATAYWTVKDYYHAKVAYEQAIALKPDSVDAWSVMAWVYMGLGDQKNATKGFQVLVDSGADRMEWKTGLTMARAGNIQIDQVRRYFQMPEPALFGASATQNVPTTVPASATTVAH